MYEDNLKNEDDLKSEYELKNEDDLKKEDNQKNEDHLKKERCWCKTDCTLPSRDRLTSQKLRVMQKEITWGSMRCRLIFNHFFFASGVPFS